MHDPTVGRLRSIPVRLRITKGCKMVSWNRKVQGRVVSLCVATIIALAFTAPPTRADDKAETLLAKARLAYKSAKSLSADIHIVMMQGSQIDTGSGSFRLRKPNLVHIEVDASQKITLMSDGKSAYQLTGNQYVKIGVDDCLAQASSMGGVACGMFFGNDANSFVRISNSGVRQYAGKRVVEGIKYDVVTITNSKPRPSTLKLFFQPDGLLGRSVAQVRINGRDVTHTVEWRREKINSNSAAQSFAIALPRGSKPFAPPEEDEYIAKLVRVGKPAPVFALPTPTGGTLSLSDAIADHKAVLVNFWNYG